MTVTNGGKCFYMTSSSYGADQVQMYHYTQDWSIAVS